MKNFFKLVRIISGLVISCFIVAGITSCSSPNAGHAPIVYLDPVDADLGDNFIGTWENNDYPEFTSTYSVAKNQIKDELMGVLFNVVSDTVGTSSDGCTLVFCQIAEGRGTKWTPAGMYYVIALRFNTDGKLQICCPVNSSSGYTTLSGLIDAYPSTCNIEEQVYGFTDCEQPESDN
ncbi:MAG: hypothetical protein KBS84_02655 [Treponema sp.]|nr:hypothetical protein [Candidatus Treponema scatequi]